MSSGQQRSYYEARLAAAHRNTFAAKIRAEDLGDDGAAEDLAEILKHLGVLMEDSLRGKHKPQLAGQTSIPV